MPCYELNLICFGYIFYFTEIKHLLISLEIKYKKIDDFYPNLNFGV